LAAGQEAVSSPQARERRIIATTAAVAPTPASPSSAASTSEIYSPRLLVSTSKAEAEPVPEADSEAPESPGTLELMARAEPPPEPQQTPTTLPGEAGTASIAVPQGVGLGMGGQRFLELRSFTNLTRITGEARNRSFLTGGRNSAVDLSYLENFGLGMRRFEASSILRYTDDPRVDPEHSSIQRAYFRMNTPNSEYNFGDYLVSYSRFTYNQNLRGLHFIRQAPWGAGFRLLGNAGVFTDRYGSLWKEEIPGKPFTRVVSGLRAEQRLSADKMIGLNWAYGNDIVRSIPIDPATGREPYIPIANNVVSFDTRMTMARIWTLDSEIAYAITNPDTRFSTGSRKDYALRVDNSVREGPWTASLFYTRIMPSFLALNARQVSDLEDMLFRTGLSLSPNVTAQFSYRRTTDDLRGERLQPGTVFEVPEIRMTFRDLPGWGSSILDVGYRERQQVQEGIADRVTRAPFVEVGIPISSLILTLGYEYRANIDNQAPSNETGANNASVALRGIFGLGDWQVNPLLRYEHNREIFQRVDTGNNTRTLQAALILDAPRYFTFEAMYRQIGATLFQDRPTLDPLTLQPIDFEVVGPTGFRRPALRFAVTYRLRNDENKFVTLSYERNNNLFALPGQDFLERVMQATVVWRIRNQ
jgi:hypothetical protein